VIDEAAQTAIADALGNGDDVIVVGDGDNRILAGDGSDSITTGAGNNDILGDTGSFDYAAGTFIADENGSGDDVIITGAGDQRILGGYGADSITTTNGNDVILSDTGTLQYNGNVLPQAKVSGFDGVGETAKLQYNLGDLTQAASMGLDGAADIITSGEGNKIVLAGAGDDQITLGNGNSDIVSDNGVLDYANQVFSADNSVSGADVITAGDGVHRVLAGNGSDSITLGAGNNDILGDTGTLDYAVGTFTADELGDGDDVIITGLGDQRILGGYGADSITTIDGNDVILGDTGSLQYNGSVLAQATAEGLNGGADIIIVGEGENIVLSGTGDDNILTGSDFDRVFADNGFIQLDGDTYLMSSNSSASDGNDIVQIGGDYNIVLGGNGDDSIKASDGVIINKNILVGDSADILFTAGQFFITQSTETGGGDDTIQGTGLLLGGEGNNEYQIGEGVYSDTLEDITLSLTDDGASFTLPSAPAQQTQVIEMTNIIQNLVFNSDITSFESNGEKAIGSTADTNILRKALLDFEVRNIKAMSSEQLRDFLRSLPIETSQQTEIKVKAVASVSKQFDVLEQSSALVGHYQRISSLINDVESDLYATTGKVRQLQIQIFEASENVKQTKETLKREPSVLNEEEYKSKSIIYNQLLNKAEVLTEGLEILLGQYDLELQGVKDDMGMSQSLVLLAMLRPAWQLNRLNNVDDSASMTLKKRSFRHWKH
jgi:hypothetical protein